MASSRLIFYFLLLTISVTPTTTSAIDTSIAPTPSPSSPPSPPPPFIQKTPLSVLAQPPPAHIQEPPQKKKFNAIIESIVGASDFSNWARLLSHADPSILSLTATLFVPENGGNSSSPFDPLLLPYHIVSRRLNFTELRQLPNGSRLPTLLPEKTLFITNISPSNFSVNGVVITHPDVFSCSSFSVHGIGATFGEDYWPDTVWESVPSPEISLVPRVSISWLAYVVVFIGFHYVYYRGDVAELGYIVVLGFVIIILVPEIVKMGFPLAVQIVPLIFRLVVPLIVQIVVDIIVQVVVQITVPLIVQYLGFD